MVKKLNTEEFKNQLFDYTVNENWKYEQEKPSVLVFSAESWCAPCKQLAPVFEEISTEYGEKINFYKVDIEDDPEIPGAFGVQSVPTILFIPTNNTPPQMSMGAIPKDSFRKAIDDILEIKI